MHHVKSNSYSTSHKKVNVPPAYFGYRYGQSTDMRTGVVMLRTYIIRVKLRANYTGHTGDHINSVRKCERSKEVLTAEAFLLNKLLLKWGIHKV